MKTGDFLLKAQDEISEIASKASIYEHEKSGAKVLFLENDDENKSFCTGFRTAPKSSNGVAHIMEHSVLCGSRKYPVKEPFVELMKGSLNTFLNAMTYPDKTVYPIASCNEEDFHNLMDVYLDSVFFPKLDKSAFLQEGWHYDCDEQGQPFYKGVVYNEMKGVYSSPESLIFQEMDAQLYPDTIYNNDSGGTPSVIPELSYEEYLDFHKEKYHPSNSWTVIYGDVDIERCLAQLNQDYFSKFDKVELTDDDLYQAPFQEEKRFFMSYPSGPIKEDAEQSFLTIGYVLCKNDKIDDVIGLQLLEQILTGNSASPLRKALNSSGLGGDVIGYGLSDQSLQLNWTIGLRDSKSARLDDFVSLVDGVFLDLVENGVPSEYVDAALNTIEFRLREANFGSTPRGVIYALNAISSWNYGNDPLEKFRYEKYLGILKEKLDEGGYLEGLIQKYFIDNKHRVIMCCDPVPGLAEKEAQLESKKLLEEWQKFDNVKQVHLKNEAARLLKTQEEADSADALATIPALSRSDIKREIVSIPFTEEFIEPITYLRSPQNSGGIVYLKWAFDLSSFGIEDIQLAKLFGSTCLSVGTANKAFDQFTTELSSCSGGVSSHFTLPSTKSGEAKRILSLSVKVMHSQLDENLSLIEELIKDLDFSDKNRLRELLNQQISKIQASFVKSGEWMARMVLNSQLSRADYLDELVSGQSYLSFLKTCVTEVESGVLSQKLKALKKRIFASRELKVLAMTDEYLLDKVMTRLKRLNTVYYINDDKQRDIAINLKPENVGLSTEGKVQYVATGINLRSHGIIDDPCFALLSQLLSTGYLWEKVRVQGGAYGCFLSYDKFEGMLNICSYRDPNLKETLDAYRGLADYIRNLNLSKAEFEKVFIGTFGRIDAPLTVSQKSGVLMSRYLAGITDKFLQERRDAILNCSQDDLRKFSKWFDLLNEHGGICVHGTRSKIEESLSLFNRVEQLAGAGGDEDEDEDDEDFFTSS